MDVVNVYLQLGNWEDTLIVFCNYSSGMILAV
jgi:hypothetical protein